MPVKFTSAAGFKAQPLRDDGEGEVVAVAAFVTDLEVVPVNGQNRTIR